MMPRAWRAVALSPDLWMIAGYLLVVTGLALWSLPVALIIGGLVLFVCGGLAVRARQ